MKKIFFLFVLMIVQVFSKEYKAPSESYSLDSWKFESPTGANIKELNGFSSKYFYLTDDNLMCFGIDSNNTSTKSLNNEIRHLSNWTVNSSHYLEATMKVTASPKLYKLVVAQIYGINENNGDVAPLLRVMIENGNLYAHIKKDKQNNEVILLKENVIDTFFTMKLKVEDKKLSIDINGQKTINKNIGFWDYKNYFKLGAFPQAKIGDFTVSVKNLSVY